MSRGATLSIILHAVLLVLVYFGLPSLFQSKPPEEQVVSIELLPIQSLTNVRPQVAKQEKKEEKKPEPPKQEPPKPEPKKEEPKPEPKKEEPKPVEEKKPEPIKPKEEKKPEPKPEQKKEKKKTPDEDFNSVLKNIEKTKPKEDFSQIEKAFSEDAPKTKKGSTNYDPTKQMSSSEKDAIIQQISKCWNVPAGAKDAKDMRVKVRMNLAEDGSVINASIIDTSRYNGGDPFYVSFADSAIRAVRLCSPLKNLPREKYGTWKEIELNFDPSQMIY